MPIATGLAIGLGAMSAAGSLGGAAIAAHGAGKQANAAMSAAQLQHQDEQDALAFQKQEYSDQQKNEAPFLKAGQGAVTTLSDLMGNGGFAPWSGSFQAPTNVTEQNDPGYQFRLQQGLKALQNSAAAKGDLLSGGTAKDLEQFASNDASQEYSNVYGRSWNQYLQKYGEYQQGQADKFNRYASIAGLGQTSAGQLGQFGQAAANNTGNILLTSGAQQGQDIQNAAAAQAGGFNAYANAFSGLGSTLMSPFLMGQRNSGYGGGYGGGGSTSPNAGGWGDLNEYQYGRG